MFATIATWGPGQWFATCSVMALYAMIALAGLTALDARRRPE